VRLRPGLPRQPLPPRRMPRLATTPIRSYSSSY
jgi:hypothetical protein